MIHYRNRRDGGPRCGVRSEGDSVKSRWADVDCPACIDLRGQPLEDAPAPEAAPPRAFKELGDPQLAQLAQICELVPISVVKRAKRDVDAVRRSGAVDPIALWGQAAAVVMDYYLGQLVDHPLATLGVSSILLASAVASTPRIEEPEAEHQA